MLRRLSPPFLALLFALAAAGCGESTEEKYEQGFKPVNDEILALSGDVGRAVGQASGKTDEQIGQEFGEFAERMGALQQDADELEPPDDLQPDQEKLVRSMGEIQGDLEGIEKAAADGDPDAARSSTIQLVRDSPALADARRKLARATGAKLGPQS